MEEELHDGRDRLTQALALYEQARCAYEAELRAYQEKTARRRGRPLLPAEQRRDEQVAAKVTPDVKVWAEAQPGGISNLIFSLLERERKRLELPNSIALVDLEGDGMIVDTTARDREAQRRVQAKIVSQEKPPTPDSNEYKSLFYSREAFYDPALLALDTLHPGADSALARLGELYTCVYILTSRPDFLATATEEWFHAHGMEWERRAIRYKLYARGEDKREQYISTALYKAMIVQQASDWFSHVLFIDNEERNRQAVLARGLKNVIVRDSLYAFDDSPMRN